MVTVEIGTRDGLVLLVISAADDSASVEVAMTADETRELCNSFGAAVLAVSQRAEVWI